jgi:TRAP-type C4-dicarboxylate transport system permease large subunit
LIEYALLLLGALLAYRSLKIVSDERVNAALFMSSIYQAIHNKNLSRGIKLSASTNAPLAKATLALLYQYQRGEPPKKTMNTSQEIFDEQAKILYTKRAIALLELLLFISLTAVCYLFWWTPREWWMLALLATIVSAMLYEQRVKTTGLADLKRETTPLAESLIASYQPSETPYR